MADSGVRVVVHIKAQPDKVEELKEVASALAKPTQSEDGCFAYDFLQNNSDPTDITLVEHWRDMAALGAHAKTDHFKQGMAAMSQLVAAEPQINLYTKFA